ncbi:gag-pol polyprotein [Cucumis melo var. makuwa]|uniref:Gag-pol polyprotein n=1 Tax=Cucumis melo var. makuwa TaxID=1194695 RepID=A0A5A7THJ5_CUCMM|nr:gag-pol polyprotein [Cucumis melo var. makuwa]
MEIIREGPSASHPLVLDGKTYSYWKPWMIFFIKMLDGKAWRALVAGYDPPMITLNGVLVPKPEVDWTDAEEQASVGNARALNPIFNGLQLITSRFEALRMTEDESASDYNKRVLEITNEFLLLGEKIPDSKIVRKVLRSLPRKFDIKVTTIEEAHDITTLKLDELFGSLLTFEMATADRESKKGKGIAFKSTHIGEEAVSDTKANMDECRECGGVDHYQAECRTYLRKQQKNFRVTLSFEESSDSRDDDGNINAFTIRIMDENSDDDSECSEESKNDDLTIEKLKVLWKEDCEARAIQKEKIQDLIVENEHMGWDLWSLQVDLKLHQKSSLFLPQWELNMKRFIQRLASGLRSNLLGERVTIMVEKTTDDAWYFDSGCSKHMTGNRSYFTNLIDCVTGHVTFGDGAKEKIIAKGNIDKNHLPRLNDVRYVDGLKANLISISQLCDQGYKTDNCYHWNSNTLDTCQLTRSDQTWRWHKKLGHVSMRGLEKIIKNEAIVGIHDLESLGIVTYGSYGSDANKTSGRKELIGNTARNGMLSQNKEYFLGTLRTAEPIESSITDLRV